MWTRPITSPDELFSRHEYFLQKHVTTEGREALWSQLPSQRGRGDWVADPPFIVARGFLRPASVRKLGILVFENGKCAAAGEHMVAGQLIDFMGDLSTYNVIEHPLTVKKSTVKQLGNRPDTPESLRTLVPPHQDHGDGHATIYTWGVRGPAQYFDAEMAEEPALLEDNMLTVVLGNYAPIHTLGYFGTDVHRVYTDVSPDDPGYAEIGRSRILVYCDGEDTGFVGDFDPAAHAQQIADQHRIVDAATAERARLFLPSRVFADE